jgi:hypothetical protein
MATMFAFLHMVKLDQEKHILWYEAVRTEVFLYVWISLQWRVYSHYLVLMNCSDGT